MPSDPAEDPTIAADLARIAADQSAEDAFANMGNYTAQDLARRDAEKALDDLAAAETQKNIDLATPNTGIAEDVVDANAYKAAELEDELNAS